MSEPTVVRRDDPDAFKVIQSWSVQMDLMHNTPRIWVDYSIRPGTIYLHNDERPPACRINPGDYAWLCDEATHYASMMFCDIGFYR